MKLLLTIFIFCSAFIAFKPERVAESIIRRPERVQAFGRVQGATASNVSPNPSYGVTVSSTSANNLIVVSIFGLNTHTVNSVTDDQGNTYVQSQSGLVGGIYPFSQYYGFQVTGAVTTVTVTFSTNETAVYINIDEFSGFTGTPTNGECFDASNYGNGTTATNAVSTAISPINSSCLIVSSGGDVNGSLSVGTGYTIGATTLFSGNEYKLTSSASENGVWTNGSSGGWMVIVTSFKQEGAVPDPTTTPVLGAVGNMALNNIKTNIKQNGTK